MEWPTKKLSDVLDIQNGYAFDSKQFSSEEGMPLIRIRDISNGLKTVTNYAGEYKSIYVVRKGDFLIGMDGEFRCYEWKGEDALLNQRVCRLQNFSDELSAKFLSYGINKYLQDIEDVTGFTTVKHISASQIKNIEFPIPPIPEQQSIVAILDQAFADIEKARANAEKNLKNARELFDSYLNQVFSQRGEGWVETLLEDVCGFKHGFAFKSEYFTQESNLVLLTPGNFFEEGGYRDRGSKQKYYKGPFPKEFLLPKGCLLVAMTEQAAGLLGSSLIVPEEKTFLHNQRLGLVQLTEAWKERVSLEFLSQLFNAHYFRAKVQETGSGLKVRHTSPKKLQAITVWIPKAKDEQCKIVNDIAHLKKETIRLELVYKNKLSSLDELKKSLLQKAFSGELTKTEGMVA